MSHSLPRQEAVLPHRDRPARSVTIGTIGEQGSARPVRVALVRPPIVSTLKAFNNEATPSIALAYIAGYLRRCGHACEIIDSIAEGLNRHWQLAAYPGYQCQGLTFDETIALIPPETEVIGFSSMFSGEWPVVRDLINAVRDHFPDALIVAGGEHITALTEFSLRDCLALDLCVIGEGEHILAEILARHAAGQDFGDIAGVAYLEDDGRFHAPSGPSRIRDIDNIPWPYWPEGYLEKYWSAEKSYGVQTERDMPMMVSRGCPFRCTFCSNSQMWTTRYSLRDVDDVVAEIKHYIERYKITAVQLYDLTAITKKKWAVDFCQKLLKDDVRLNWSLPSGTRSEALDAETLSLLHRTGLNYLVYAPESGSERTLKAIRKQISLAELTGSAMIAKKLGLIIRTNLIIGFPEETRADVFDTIRYGLKLAAKGADEVSINIFSPYPGTAIFSALLDAGAIKLDDAYFLSLTSLNSDYSVLNPMTVNKHMGARELAFYRIGFMLANYIVGYIFYPRRIIRTLGNIFGRGRAATVLEHRLKDMIKRKRARKATASVKQG